MHSKLQFCDILSIAYVHKKAEHPINCNVLLDLWVCWFTHECVPLTWVILCNGSHRYNGNNILIKAFIKYEVYFYAIDHLRIDNNGCSVIYAFDNISCSYFSIF